MHGGGWEWRGGCTYVYTYIEENERLDVPVTILSCRVNLELVTKRQIETKRGSPMNGRSENNVTPMPRCNFRSRILFLPLFSYALMQYLSREWRISISLTYHFVYFYYQIKIEGRHYKLKKEKKILFHLLKFFSFILTVLNEYIVEFHENIIVFDEINK